MQKLKSDVTVIGAGPAGSNAARVIAKHGFDVILVEKDEHPGKTNVCAGGMAKSVIKDMKLNSDVIEKEISGQVQYFQWGMKYADLDHITVCRDMFDKSLADKAVDEGAKMLTNTLIKDISVKNDKLYLYSKGCVIDSKLVVFADGPNTLAYKKFGIGFKPESDKTMISVACEVEWENNPLDQFEFYYGSDIAPWGYGWIFPKRNTVNVGVGCLYSEVHSNIIESLNYLLRKHPLVEGKLKEKKNKWLSSALIPVAPARRIFGERMLVAGDAAGMVDPITGGGIAPSITGGKLAGTTCVNALEEEDFSTALLSQYQNSWHKTNDYFHIYSTFLLSNAFLYFSKFDKNAYQKMVVITQGGTRNMVKTLKFMRHGKYE